MAEEKSKSSTTSKKTAQKTVKKAADKKVDSFLGNTLSNVKTKDGESITKNKTFKKLMKKLTTTAKIVAVVFFFIGSGVGAFVGSKICAKDTFELLPVSTQNTMLLVDASNTQGKNLEIAGAKLIAYGKDISDKVDVQCSKGLTYNADGTFSVDDMSEEATYYIIYTTKNMKFSKIKKIRYISVVNEITPGEAGGIDD